MQESWSISPNTRTASYAGGRMLNPSWTLYCIYPQMNPNISGVHADECGPFLIASSRGRLPPRNSPPTILSIGGHTSQNGFALVKGGPG